MQFLYKLFFWIPEPMLSKALLQQDSVVFHCLCCFFLLLQRMLSVITAGFMQCQSRQSDLQLCSGTSIRSSIQISKKLHQQRALYSKCFFFFKVSLHLGLFASVAMCHLMKCGTKQRAFLTWHNSFIFEAHHHLSIKDKLAFQNSSYGFLRSYNYNN